MGKKVVVNKVTNYLETKIVFYLMNLHITPRKIWLTRHGESEYNVLGRIGGDSSLSGKGQEYARRLGEWVLEQVGVEGKLIVWTSTLKRTIQTAQYIPKPKVHLKELDEIDAGDMDGLTYQEIAQKVSKSFLKLFPLHHILLLSSIPLLFFFYSSSILLFLFYFSSILLLFLYSSICLFLYSFHNILTFKNKKYPEDHNLRTHEKLKYRYPRGESYQDVIHRLEPVMFELERTRQPILVVAHQAVLRALYAYFMNKPPEEVPFLSIPLHQVIEIIPKAYGCTFSTTQLI